MSATVKASPTLDVLVPTFRRARSLERTLGSLMSARVPAEFQVRVTVIQNDDERGTAEVIEAFAAQHPGRITHLRESRSGKSNALNAGIRSTTGDLIGVIDDDEDVSGEWYAAVAEAFTDPRVDFIGGPCLPRWGAVPPGWLPEAWQGVIGYVDNGDRPMVFDRATDAMLMGGNSVIRRSTLERIGLYCAELGPSASRRLFSCEDEDLYQRLLGAGAYGLYVPGMRVYHFVPSHRLTKAYYRSWSFWNGVSKSVLEKVRPSPVTRVGRVPRYLMGAAVRAVVRMARTFHRDPIYAFEGQLTVLQFLGFLYGTYLYRPGAR